MALNWLAAFGLVALLCVAASVAPLLLISH